ncbi:PilZ domain-containing protein [Leptospira langatensis]|uniref:PilZ domain-containing protein n=1 Tax=Leptospira langatensis TaxID=2484983 RepID=A0A5F1ZQW3_9LEPT|nr:PilZ domain-containing protein [Leptospira langatensis]TGK02608.1 PilZ domain-containing protein [Leptospira langatensis]TGL40190.1 PilZ domain-containing protein [Leptospira langatensis]
MSARKTQGREYDTLSDHSVIYKIIKSFLYMEKLGIKGGSSADKCEIINISNNSEMITVRFSDNFQPASNERILLQKTLKKHIELNCRTINRIANNEFTLQIESIHIAKENRKDDRIFIRNDSVFATNVVYHPKQFELNHHTSPNLMRTILETFSQDLNHPKFGEIKIGSFERGQELKFNIVRKTKKIFFIPDTSKTSSYTENLPQFVNYITYFGKNILSAIRRYRNESITSELILPILFDKNDKDSYPKAYLWVQSKVEPILAEDLPELYALANKVSEKIESSDSVKATNRFDILDISESGARIKISDKNIIYCLYPCETLKFDLVFKGKPPIPINGKICWRTMDRKGKLYLGLKFEQEKELLPSLRKLEYNIQSLRNKMHAKSDQNSSLVKIYRSPNARKRKSK